MNTFSCSSQDLEDQNRPKLENFLGVHQEQKSTNNLYQLNMYQETDTNTSNNTLPMITNWLRNNPPPPHAAENNEPPPPAAAAAAAAASSAQTLSLSMSTGSPLQPDTKLGTAAVEAQASGAIESVPRRSIDTFGQRTSIYRGVTRFIYIYL